jgi:CAAX protease family protein
MIPRDRPGGAVVTDGRGRALARPWGVLATLAWGLPIISISLLIQQIIYRALFAAVFLRSPTAQLRPLAWALFIAPCVMTVLTLVVVRLRRGWRTTDYLAIRPVEWRTAGPWILVGSVAVGLATFVHYSLGDQADVTANLLTQDDLYVYLVSLVLLGPANEEIVFRGFLLTGLAESRWRYAIAVPLTAALWSAFHANPTFVAHAVIFLLGCLLGLMRASCGSIIPGLLVHVLNNALVVGIETADSLQQSVW